MTTAQERAQLQDVTARSRDCPYCGGVGLARVFSPTYRGEPVETVMDRRGTHYRVPAAVNAHCLCPLGRWIRAQYTGDMLARTPDLVEVLAGRSRWIARDPSLKDEG